MSINKVTLAKEVNSTIEYLYPKSTADIIEYSNIEHDATTPTMSVQDKLDELHDGLSDLDESVTTEFTYYYTKLDVNDILYKPVTIDTFTSSVTTAEIGSSGNTTLTYKVTRMTKLTSLVVAGVTLTNPDTSDLVMEKSFTGSQTAAYNSASASATSQSYTMSVTDTATTNHAATTATKSVTINFYWPVFWGIIDSTSTPTTSQILGLNRTLKANNKGTGTYTYPANTTNGYLWFCCDSGSSVSFAVGGFSGGFESAVNVSGVSINGLSRTYKCYRSTNRMTASVSVVVS